MKGLNLCEHVWTRKCVRVSVCLMHGRPALLWIRPLKHWAAGQQLVCDSFYWNYLFLITIGSKLNLFHKQSVQQSFFEWWKEYVLPIKRNVVILESNSFYSKKEQFSQQNSETQANHREYISINFSIKITRSHFTKKGFCAILTWNVY